MIKKLFLHEINNVVFLSTDGGESSISKSTSDGLPHKEVTKVRVDHNDTLFISTLNGISIISLDGFIKNNE